jgi:DNA-binding LacI/PurR family transcriptional regulator
MQLERLDYENPKLLYLQVANIIEQKIRNNELGVGQRVPPQRELHKELGVSLDTIKDALGILEKEGYITRRPSLGTFVISSEPKTNTGLTRKNGICFILCSTPDFSGFDFGNLMYQLMLKGIQQKMKENGAYLGFSILNENENELSLGGKEKEIAGLIVAGGKTPKHLSVIKRSRIPFVLIGDIFSKTSAGENADVIANNDFDGLYLAASHLTGLGHRRIAYIHEPLRYSWDKEKLEGYKKALREAGISFDKELLIELEKTDSETAYKAMKEFLEKSIPFTGLIGFDLDGIGQALKEKDLRVPEDISEVDFGSTKRAHVSYNAEDLGRLAVERLYGRLTNAEWKPERITVPNRLVAGDSTRKIEER